MKVESVKVIGKGREMLTDEQLDLGFVCDYCGELENVAFCSECKDSEVKFTAKVIAQAKEANLLSVEVNRLRRENEVLREGLNNIACWNEGEVVNGSFDCPGDAKFARETLAKADAIREGRM